jgi:polyphenol oxidase
MGHLGFAGRDPIFYSHHGNIDKIWSRWNARSATTTTPAYRNPTDPAFLSERWNFFDESQRVVSISAADVLNHQNNLRYSYPSSSTSSVSTPISPEITVSTAAAPLVSTHPARLSYSGTGIAAAPALDVSYSAKTSVLEAVSQQASVMIVLTGVTVPENAIGVFDIMSVRGSRTAHLGLLAIVADTMRMTPLPRTVVLDATDAAHDLLDTSNPARITLVPREGNGSFTLQAEDAELRVVSQR